MFKRMKLPCELIVNDVLPTARGAIARSLVRNHGYTQIRVAETFGVTGAAVSQYLKGLRGGNPVIDNSSMRDDFYKMTDKAADMISEGYNVTEVLCAICTYVKSSGLIDSLYESSGSEGTLASCSECPRFNIYMQ
jgi:predicted transcriptional regulator